MPHEPTDACHQMHCYIHNEDELDVAYLICFECKHRYPSAEQLVADFIASLRAADVDVDPNITADQIYFCAHCSHDF